MRLKPKTAAFLAFTAFFAVLAGVVFWGTWSLDTAPVMPDHPVSWSLNHVEQWVRGWLTTGKFVPGDALVFLGSPYFWQELKYVLALYCAALGMAYFLRGRGLSRLASYGAGLLLAFCGYWCTLFSAGHFGWFQWMTYGVFAFGLVDRALIKGRIRHWLLLGAVLAWGSFYQPDLWLLFSVFQFAYFVFRFVALKAWSLPVLKGCTLALVAFVLIGFPSFRQAITHDLAGRDQQIAEGQTVGAGVADDAEKRWIFTTNWSMPPEATLEFFNEGVHGDTSCPLTLAIGRQRRNGVTEYTGRLGRPLGAPAGNYRQHSLYVGWITCLLALAGVVFGIRRKDATVIFFACAALLFWVVSMGRFCEPVYRVVFSLPMGDYLRAPVKWHHLTEFSLVVLAGFGLDALGRRFAARGRWVPFVLGGIVAWGAIDLAASARKFCAPRAADAELQFIQADARQLQRPEAAMQLRQMGLRVVGTLPNRGLAIVEKRRPRTRAELDASFKPSASIVASGVASLAATLGVLAFALVSVARRRNRGQG